MRGHLARDLRPALRFGQNERALQHRLRVQGEALCGPIAFDFVLFARGFDIGFECGGVAEYAGLAGGADGVVRRERLLHHRAGKAGELCGPAFDERGAEIDVSEHPAERIAMRMIGRGCKESARRLRPIIRRRDREIVLAFEVMEEGALGDARSAAKIVHRRAGVTLRPDNLDR